MTSLEKIWYGRNAWRLALVPLAILFCSLVWLRRKAYKLKLLRQAAIDVPVIIAGNISVGGTGKTPLVIWLVEWLKDRGYQPGIVARGYGGKARNWPQQVRPDSDPQAVGDEPVLIAQRTGCPMAVGPDRVAAAQALLQHSRCDVIVSDDGLQHYRLGRDIEILVLDGVRRLGNGWCLPAGPLREPESRLKEVDCIVTHGVAGRGEYRMRLVLGDAVNLVNGATRPLNEFPPDSQAIAGVGNPERFFASLRQAGMNKLDSHACADHQDYSEADLETLSRDLPLLMTEKDAVKIRRMARDNYWYVPATAELDDQFSLRLERLMNTTGNTHG